jgi:predicted dehydrogenase
LRRLGIGVVGAGRAGRAHLEAIRRLGGMAELVAVAIRDDGQAAEVQEAFAVPRRYADHRALLEDPRVEVVHDCATNAAHLAVNRDSIEAGRHVLSEKPLGLDSAETGLLRDLAVERGVASAVNFPYRHHACVQHLRGMVEKGELGRINAVTGAFLQDWLLLESDYDWRVEASLGGPSRALADIGSHWLDLATFLLGSRVVEVLADLATFVPTRFKPAVEGGRPAPIGVDTEDYASLLLRFEDGARGAFSVSQASAGHKLGLWIQIDGSRASARWEQARADELWIGRRDGPNEVLSAHPSLLNSRGLASRALGGAPPVGLPERWPEAQKSMIAAFYRGILEGAKPDCADFAAAHKIQCAIDAALESHRARAWRPVA